MKKLYVITAALVLITAGLFIYWIEQRGLTNKFSDVSEEVKKSVPPYSPNHRSPTFVLDREQINSIPGNITKMFFGVKNTNNQTSCFKFMITCQKALKGSCPADWDLNIKEFDVKAGEAKVNEFYVKTPEQMDSYLLNATVFQDAGLQQCEERKQEDAWVLYKQKSMYVKVEDE